MHVMLFIFTVAKLEYFPAVAKLEEYTMWSKYM